jgi:hypothetical protein
MIKSGEVLLNEGAFLQPRGIYWIYNGLIIFKYKLYY